MAYNEAEIINEMFNLYDMNNKIYSVDVIYNQLREILYNLVIYNDDDNINDIINQFGGYEIITPIYNNKYVNTSILDIDVEGKLNINTLTAFIGIFDYLFMTIIEVIEEIENEKKMDSLCDLMANL